MCTTTKSTVPVRCPNCRHQGPAFSYLLGQRSRCKICNHVFQIPKHVRIDCPGCGIALRVLSEEIDRHVICKFCSQAFRVSPDLLKGATALCPGEHAAIGSMRNRSPENTVTSEIEEELRAARAELIRMEQERKAQAERILVVEQALLRVLGDQEALKASLKRLENDNVRTQSSRLEDERKAVKDLDRLRFSALQPGPCAPPPFPQNHGRSNGHGRLSSRPPQRTAATARATAKPPGERSNLGDAMDQISRCELKADLLVSQLKTTKEARELERHAFEQILERLQEELSWARSESEIARGNLKPSDERDPNSDEEPCQLAAVSHLAVG
jgi:hypothetical protein